MDYCDVVYDQPWNDAFSDKLETVQYNAALAIAGAIKDIFFFFFLYKIISYTVKLKETITRYLK